MAKSLPKTPKFRRRHLAVGLALLWGLLISLAQVVGVFRDFDQPLLDLRQSLPTEVPLVENNLALVEINEIPAARGWPWPRLDYAILLRSLLPYNPQGIVFEMLLHERDTQYSAFDARFAGTVRNMNEVVFAAAGLSAEEEQPLPNNLNAIPATNVDPSEMAQFHSLLWPLPAFAENSRVGLNNLLPSSSQQPRRIPLVFWYNGQIVPSLALQAAGSRLNISWALSEVVMGDAIYMRDGNGVLQRTIPIDQEGRLFMRYRPNYPAPWTATFDNVPLYARVAETGGEPEQNLREVKDRLVFVGRTDSPTFNAIPGLVPPTSNVQVQMLATRNILNADYIYDFPSWLIIPIYLFVAATAGLFFFYYGPGPGLFLLAILFGSWMETAILAFRGYSIDLPMVSFGMLLLGLIPISFAAAHWGMRPVTRTPRPTSNRSPQQEQTPAIALAEEIAPSYVQPSPVEVQQLGMGFEEESPTPAATTNQPAQASPVVNEQGITTLPLTSQTAAVPEPEPEPEEEEVPEPDPDDYEKALARLAEIHEHIEQEEQAEQERRERERQEKELRAAREQLEAERRKREEERQRRENQRKQAVKEAQEKKTSAALAEAKTSKPEEKAPTKEEKKEPGVTSAKPGDLKATGEKEKADPEKKSEEKKPEPAQDKKDEKQEAKSSTPESKKNDNANKEDEPKTSPPEKTVPEGKPVEKANSPVKPESTKEEKKDEPAKPVSFKKGDAN